MIDACGWVETSGFIIFRALWSSSILSSTERGNKDCKALKDSSFQEVSLNSIFNSSVFYAFICSSNLCISVGMEFKLWEWYKDEIQVFPTAITVFWVGMKGVFYALSVVLETLWLVFALMRQWTEAAGWLETRWLTTLLAPVKQSNWLTTEESGNFGQSQTFPRLCTD